MTTCFDLVEELFRKLAKLRKKIRDGDSAIDRIQKNIEEMSFKKKTLLTQLQKIFSSSGTKEIYVGKVRIRLIEDIDVKIQNLDDLPQNFFIEEKSLFRYPLFRKLKRELLLGKLVPGAILVKIQRVEIRWRSKRQ
ncbi:MAG: hypothetical protein HQM08_18875 [Candidatus Riflebacteria bacterium]|nr:hypothetical protein [Candidatus Riflebacteria bacterium]